MKFGKMMACAAILGCTSAVNLDTENTLERNSQEEKWRLPKDLMVHISEFDWSNGIGFMGAGEECARTNGRREFCKTLEHDV